MPNVLALILAGGRVDELGVLTRLRPKSVMPFGGLYRIIDFPLSNLMNSGIERVGVLCQYRSSSIVEHIGSGSSWDMVGRERGVTLLPPFQGASASDWYKGTADAVYQNIDFIEAIKPDLVLILSGDHVYHMDYQEMIDFHLNVNADLTCAFVRHHNKDGPSRFGEAIIDNSFEKGGMILSYKEKPSVPHSEWVSMTVYLFNTNLLLECLRKNAKDSSHEFGRDILPSLVGEKSFWGYRFSGYWSYSRTVGEYYQANMDMIGDSPKLSITDWNVRTNLDHEAIRDRGPSLIGPNAFIENSRIHNGVKIDGEVKNSILFPGVSIGKGARVSDSILFFDTQIGEGAQVKKTITDIAVTIGRDAVVGDEHGKITVIGAGASIGMGERVEDGAEIMPAKGIRI